MNLINSYPRIKQILYAIFKEFGGDYGKLSNTTPIYMSDKINLVIFGILIYVLRTEFSLTYRELEKLTNRSTDTLSRHNNSPDAIIKLYDVPDTLVARIHDYIVRRILDYVESENDA